jgi:RNA polymerase sigma factor (sigma-70 family)
MQAMSDMELLQEYAFRSAEEAFATLVSRYVDLVYSAALRYGGNHHQAQEITQAVFVILARKARSLSSNTILAGWLFQTTRLTAANFLRTEIRRTRREQEAYMQSTPDDHSTELWQQLAPVLNDAIAGLGEKDRNAVVLRFLQGKDFKEVGVALGATEEAAQMRVGRALEKLRKIFAKRGVVLSAAALGGIMAAQATQAAPSGLAASVAAGAVHGTTLTTSTLTLVKGTLNVMAWTKTQFALGAGVLVLLACQYYENSTQARQLAAAREDLRGRSEALSAEESRIAELEQQTTAIAEIRNGQEADLAQLRARRASIPNVAGTSPSGVPTTLLSASLQDPDAREYLRRQMVNDCRNRYARFFRESKVDPEVAETLIQKGGDYSMKNLDAIAAFTEGRISAEAAVQAEAETVRDGSNQVCQALGEAGAAKFEEYLKSRPGEVLMAQLDERLTWVYGLNADQRARMSEIFRTEPPEVMKSLVGELTVAALVYPDKLNRWFESQTEVNRDILQKGAGFLNPDQLEIIELMQRSNLSTQKRNVLQLLRKQ